MTVQEAIESGNWPEQNRIERPGMFGGMAKFTNILCSDGKFRVFTAIGEPDTFFTQPGKVYVKGKTVSGFVWFDSMFDHTRDGIWKFTAHSYRKNANILPVWM